MNAGICIFNHTPVYVSPLRFFFNHNKNVDDEIFICNFIEWKNSFDKFDAKHFPCLFLQEQ